MRCPTDLTRTQHRTQANSLLIAMNSQKGHCAAVRLFELILNYGCIDVCTRRAMCDDEHGEDMEIL